MHDSLDLFKFGGNFLLGELLACDFLVNVHHVTLQIYQADDAFLRIETRFQLALDEGNSLSLSVIFAIRNSSLDISHQF